MAHIIPSSISRTALDSLYAKLSAFDSGWLEGDDGLGIYDKLLHCIHDGISIDSHQATKRRRQSPLVNAGYSARIAVMTHILEQWIPTSVNNAENNNNTCINIVLIGCGIDVLGIWCKYLLKDTLPIRIYEFDAWDNCILKQKAMVKSKLLKETYSFETNDEQTNSSIMSISIISKGQITMDDGGKNQNNTEDDYCLAALDLRQTYKEDHKLSVLSHAIYNVGLDTSQPTIVLSELVLAYLGYDGANATMSSVAKDILRRGNEYSMFACLEPVFPCSDQGTKTMMNNTTKIQSVEESYSMDYSQQFLGKLQKGNSKYTASSADSNIGISSSSWLHPLGDNMKSIQQRLEKCGFPSSNIFCTTLGTAAANVAQIRRSYAPNFLRANELFDEHSALALNLSCYGVVCAFASETKSTIIHNAETSQDWRQKVCPWKSSSYIQIHPIATLIEDNQVRELYGQIYCHLYEEYPAIRRMVKSALKTDLCIKGTQGETSIVRSRFTDKGGSFWVATDNNNFDRIIGCIGVRLRKKTGKEMAESISSTSLTIKYEIQRLAVDNTHRGNGIGRKLLPIVEEYTCNKEESKRNSDDPFMIKLLATTPECLIAANKLYNSSGYELVDTFQAGSLCMNVYCKTLTI